VLTRAEPFSEAAFLRVHLLVVDRGKKEGLLAANWSSRLAT
jgi:hypothetical protein